MRDKKTSVLADIGYELAGAALYSLGYYVFAMNGGFATGGVSGISLMVHHFTQLPMGAITAALNVPLVLFTFRSLGRDFLIRSVRTLAFITLSLDLVWPNLAVPYQGDPMVAALFTGVLSGAGMGLIYTRGGSTGGSDFVVAAVRKHNPHLSFGQITAALDGIIILSGWPVYGSMDAVLYALIVTFANTMVMDSVVNGSVSGKMTFIITKYGQETANAISEAIDRGATLLPAKGSYTGRDLDMLVCACSKMELPRVRRIAHQVDPNAMVMICDAAEVVGEGFVLPEP